MRAPTAGSSAPITTRSGSAKSRTAVPSRRNSGFDAYAMSCRPRASSAWRSVRPVPAGTVDFMTRVDPAALAGSESSTACTRSRSASPDAVGGVSTHTNAMRARSKSSAGSSVKCRRASVPADELGKTRLVQRDLAARELREPLAVDVESDHVMAEVGEGGGGHEADPPDADHAEGLAPASAHFGGTGCRLRAIATIVLFVRLSPSVLSTHTTYWRLGP